MRRRPTSSKGIAPAIGRQRRPGRLATMRSTIYQRIVVLLDGRPNGERGLAWVRQLARGSGTVVHLVLIRPPGASVRDGIRVLAFADEVDGETRAAALAYLEPAAARLREDGLTVMTHVRIRKPVGGALRYVSVTFLRRSSDGKATMIGSARLVGPEGPTPDADQLKPSPCPRRAECSAKGSPCARAGGPCGEGPRAAPQDAGGGA